MNEWFHGPEKAACQPDDVLCAFDSRYDLAHYMITFLSCPDQLHISRYSMMTKTEQAGRECIQILTQLCYLGSTYEAEHCRIQDLIKADGSVTNMAQGLVFDAHGVLSGVSIEVKTLNC